MSIIYLYTIKWFQICLPYTNNLIKYQSFVCTLWSGYKHCYITLIILFNTIHSFAQSEGSRESYLILKIQLKHSIKEFKTNNSIQHYSFLC